MDTFKEIDNFMKRLIKDIKTDDNQMDIIKDSLKDNESIFYTFFKLYFESIEEHIFCSDKAKYVSKKMKEALLKNLIETDKDGLCFYCPKTFRDTDTAFIIFYSHLIDIRHNKSSWKSILRYFNIKDSKLY